MNAVAVVVTLALATAAGEAADRPPKGWRSSPPGAADEASEAADRASVAADEAARTTPIGSKSTL